MFTGIVRELGTVVSLTGGPGGLDIRLRAPTSAAAAQLGDSIALNGVCLTVTGVDGEELTFDAVPETIERTSLSALADGARVNVEPALRAGDPLGGHIVQGHVDGVATVSSLAPEGDGQRLTIELPPELARYAVEKGSIAVEGVSLTVAAVDGCSVQIALVPHTLEATTLSAAREGAQLNIEVDVLAKYVERLVQPMGPRHDLQ